ncbi:hydrogenase subunit MbhD domain-containing protein [Streptomyces sp. NPDC059913]|uniref:hydrogenase subunit MbhD domain-containing protein n=1 Tax=unclassified Streptomyces TaxID=2593676 RepID=UPI00332DF7E8
MADALIPAALALVVVAATAAALVSDPVRQALVLSLLGLGLAALFLVLQAPDVALSQLAVGSALTPLLLLLTVRTSRRRARRTGDDKAATAEPEDGKPR